MSAFTATHALITGGGSGIGRAIALTLAQAGIAITIAGRREDALKETAALHDGIKACIADVTDEPAMGRAASRRRRSRHTVRHRRGQCRLFRQCAGRESHASRLACDARRQSHRRVPHRPTRARRDDQAPRRAYYLRCVDRGPQGLCLCRALCRSQTRRRRDSCARLQSRLGHRASRSMRYVPGLSRPGF